MKKLAKSLLTLALISLTACGGSGGGDGGEAETAETFDFSGGWGSNLRLMTNNCGQTEFAGDPIEESTTLLALVTQNNNSAVVEIIFLGIAGGSVSGNSLMATTSQNFFFCPNGDIPSDSTTTLVYADTEGDISSDTSLTILSNCPNFTETCEITFNGSSLRLRPADDSGNDGVTTASDSDGSTGDTVTIGGNTFLVDPSLPTTSAFN